MDVNNLKAKVSIMAIYTLTIKHFRFPHFFVFFSLFMITNFFSVLTPITFTSALSFNFPSFTSQDLNISYENAFADEDQVIQLTGSKLKAGLAGRATYFRPMHLWDKASRNLTDFATHFSFVIDSQNQPEHADGLTFFLAPNGSKISALTNGSNIGLYNPALSSRENCFVAVEFDICSNPEWDDPPGEHVGIDINSMTSVANVSWLSNVTERNEAWISYNSSSQNLSVVFTVSRNNDTVLQSLSHIVDLRDYLPEWVTFGFSAATGKFYAIHTIYSWEFNSSLEIDNNNANPKGPSLALSPKKKNMSMLVVGFIAGGFILVGGLAMVLFGIVALELACGRKPVINEAPEDQVVMLDWVRELHGRELLLNAADQRLGGHFDEQQMKCLLNVGLWCAHFEYDRRPSIREVIQVLNFEAPLPLLQLDTPRSSHHTPTMNKAVALLSTSNVMLNWVKELHERGEVLNATDQRLGGHINEQQMKCLLIVGLWCAHFKCDRRPSIREAIQVLNFEVPLPLLQLDTHISTMNEATSSLSNSN
ncbi:agglutinin-2 [Quercus suber]|uniref:Agglutinin-2 n=1 Tax=Quercus suber TaxID=58331 RepID=A0AAW0MCC5_QUESU